MRGRHVPRPLQSCFFVREATELHSENISGKSNVAIELQLDQGGINIAMSSIASRYFFQWGCIEKEGTLLCQHPKLRLHQNTLHIVQPISSDKAATRCRNLAAPLRGIYENGAEVC